VASLNDKLDERSYIVPGLGDAGDLSYGTKLYNCEKKANTDTLLEQSKPFPVSILPEVFRYGLLP
jgi:hypothetical protein